MVERSCGGRGHARPESIQRWCERPAARGDRGHRLAHHPSRFHFGEPDRFRAVDHLRGDGIRVRRANAGDAAAVRADGNRHVQRPVERRPGQSLAARHWRIADPGAGGWQATHAGRRPRLGGPERPPARADRKCRGGVRRRVRCVRLRRDCRCRQLPAARRDRGDRVRRRLVADGARRWTGVLGRSHRRHVVRRRSWRRRGVRRLRRARAGQPGRPAPHAVSVPLLPGRDQRLRPGRRVPRRRFRPHRGRLLRRLLQPRRVQPAVRVIRLSTGHRAVLPGDRRQRGSNDLHVRRRRDTGQRRQLSRGDRSGHVQRPAR